MEEARIDIGYVAALARLELSEELLREMGCAGSARRLDRFFAADADAVHIIVPQRPKPTGLHRAARAGALLLAHRRTRRGDGHRPFAEAVFVRLGGIVGVRIVGVRIVGVVGIVGLHDAARVVARRRSVAGGKGSAAERQQDGQKQAHKFFHTFPCLISISLTV